MRIALPKFSRSVSKSYGCIVILRIMYFNMMVHTGFEPVKRCPFRVLALQCHLTLMPQIKYDALPRVLLLRRMHPAFLAVRGLDTFSILSSEFAAPLNGLANPCSFGLHSLPLTLQISFQNTIIETHSATVGQTTASKIRCRAVTIWAYYFALSAFQL